jgi:hypothetical protein
LASALFLSTVGSGTQPVDWDFTPDCRRVDFPGGALLGVPKGQTIAALTICGASFHGWKMILAGIGASIMTVVSIVFAILLMTLTLASMQLHRAPAPPSVSAMASGRTRNPPRKLYMACRNNRESRLFTILSLKI